MSNELNTQHDSRRTERIRWACNHGWNPGLPHLSWATDPAFINLPLDEELIGGAISYNGQLHGFVISGEYRKKGYACTIWLARRDRLLARQNGAVQRMMSVFNIQAMLKCGFVFTTSQFQFFAPTSRRMRNFS